MGLYYYICIIIVTLGMGNMCPRKSIYENTDNEILDSVDIIDTSPPIDIDSLEEEFEKSFVKEILIQACDDLHKTMDLLRNSIILKNYQSIRDLSHGIKGVALIMKCKNIAKYSLILEHIEDECVMDTISNNFMLLESSINIIDEFQMEYCK